MYFANKIAVIAWVMPIVHSLFTQVHKHAVPSRTFGSTVSVCFSYQASTKASSVFFFSSFFCFSLCVFLFAFGFSHAVMLVVSEGKLTRHYALFKTRKLEVSPQPLSEIRGGYNNGKFNLQKYAMQRKWQIKWATKSFFFFDESRLCSAQLVLVRKETFFFVFCHVSAKTNERCLHSVKTPPSSSKCEAAAAKDGTYIDQNCICTAANCVCTYHDLFIKKT